MTVICIGNFDGVHSGHAWLIDQAKALGRAPSVLTFDPHPRAFFSPESPPFALTNAVQRTTYLRELGVDRIVTLPFDEALAALSAHAFATSILRDRLQATAIVAGTNFQFGKNRSGHMGLLADLGPVLGFSVHGVDLHQSAGASASSTRIRDALATGSYNQATALWGRNFVLQGEVVRGDQLGRTLGFPTANLAWGAYLRPQFGVYASRACLPDGRCLDSVTNLGRRPTVDGVQDRFETHVFDFAEDLYGAILSVELTHFIRPEQSFEGLPALKAQIAVDCDTARAMLAQTQDCAP